MSDQNWQPGQTLHIDATEINPYKQQSYSRVFGGGGYLNRIQNDFRMTPSVAERTLSLHSDIKNDYEAKLHDLPQQIQTELSTNGAVSTATTIPADSPSIERDQLIVNRLIQLRTERLQSSLKEANSFYGSDPNNKSNQEYISTFNRYIRQDYSARETHKHWARSYAAGYSVKLYTESIRLLTQRSNQLNAAYVDARARQKAARQAEARARDIAEQQAKAEFRAKQEESRRAEQRRKQQIATELADRFDAMLHQFTQNQPEGIDEKLRWMKDKYQELYAANLKASEAEREVGGFYSFPKSGKRWGSLENAQHNIEELVRVKHGIENVNLTTVGGAVASAQPLVITPDGVIAGYEGAPFSVSRATESLSNLRALAISGPVAAFFASVFYTPTLGNGELQRNPVVVTIPLSQFGEDEAYTPIRHKGKAQTDWLPYRVVASVHGEHTQLYFTPPDNSPFVQVRQVKLDPETNLYTFTTEGLLPRTLTWTPNNAPGDGSLGSTELPAHQSDIKIYPGARVTQIEGRTDEHPMCDQADVDDYILEFPAESGIEPVYVMVSRSGPRYEPGTVTGMGQAVGENWLGSAGEAGGAPIPAQIADQLRGQDFRSFDKFREKFWSAVTNDSELSKQLSPLNKAIAKGGYSPYAPRSEQVGGREKFEIHHMLPIGKGGEVYNIDNMAITTPKAHIAEHSKDNGESL